jgi:hypothetical protein
VYGSKICSRYDTLVHRGIVSQFSLLSRGVVTSRTGRYVSEVNDLMGDKEYEWYRCQLHISATQVVTFNCLKVQWHCRPFMMQMSLCLTKHHAMKTYWEVEV